MPESRLQGSKNIRSSQGFHKVTPEHHLQGSKTYGHHKVITRSSQGHLKVTPEPRLQGSKNKHKVITKSSQGHHKVIISIRQSPVCRDLKTQGHHKVITRSSQGHHKVTPEPHLQGSKHKVITRLF